MAPHGKTSMSPELVGAQLAAGAWAISAATPAQVRVFWEFGVPRVLLANELVDRAGIAWIAQNLTVDPAREFLCYVDSLRGVEILTDVFPGWEPTCRSTCSWRSGAGGTHRRTNPRRGDGRRSGRLRVGTPQPARGRGLRGRPGLGPGG